MSEFVRTVAANGNGGEEVRASSSEWIKYSPGLVCHRGSDLPLMICCAHLGPQRIPLPKYIFRIALNSSVAVCKSKALFR